MKKLVHARRSQNGFSLIEVLITIVIIALGLLGFAGLQTYALKSNRIAMQRSLATMQAYDIVDSMRANRAAAIASGYNQDYVNATCTTPTASGAVAADDLAAWNAAIACALPAGQGKITVAANGTVTIWIKWKESTTAADAYLAPWSTETSI